MKVIDLYVNNDDGEELHYKVAVAESDEDRKKGLQGQDKLEPDEGMLFVFPEEQEVSMWMKDTKIPLTVAFINKDFEVTAVYDAEPYDETYMTEKAMYVLEVNADEDIDEGDDVVFDIDNTDYEFTQRMKILDENGKVQGYLHSGERIVSRHETEVLIRKAKLCRRWANRSEKKYKKYCKELGRYIFGVIERQDNRPPEYVEEE